MFFDDFACLKEGHYKIIFKKRTLENLILSECRCRAGYLKSIIHKLYNVYLCYVDVVIEMPQWGGFFSSR